ncbi:MAG TPA: prolyl oligopeptidase family serine peptidase [Candidatus Acidoferrum sp.]|nr:prolyl oligopeptidase family serine peptidase [Candidatus Acidoferrum sp.]
MHKLTPAFLACALLAMPTIAQDEAELSMHKRLHFEKKIVKTVEANYLLFLPEGYRPKGDKQFPLMIFLHGAGERGTNLSRVAQHGPPKIVKTQKDFPFILVSPQCPSGSWWTEDVVMGLLDEVIAKHNVDTNRVYLTGLSMGGFGTWAVGTKYPERFAAIAPICGGGERIGVLLAGRSKAASLKTLGVWAFHGAKDPVVQLAESERMVDAFQKAGCNDVKLTIYPEAGHDSWTEAYNNPELWDWFLRHSRAGTQSSDSAR